MVQSPLNAVLVVQLCDESVKEGEIERVAATARANNAIFQHIPLTPDRVEHLVAVCSRQLFDLVYICGHGGEDADGEVKTVCGSVGGFEIEMTFPQLASILCDNLTPNAAVLLSCCDGGHAQIAADMMAVCHSMNWVFGVPNDAEPAQLDAVFNPFLFQIARGQNPGRAKVIAEANGRVDHSPDPGLSRFEFKGFRREDRSIEIDDSIHVISEIILAEAESTIHGRYINHCDTIFYVGEFESLDGAGLEPVGVDYSGEWVSMEEPSPADRYSERVRTATVPAK